MAVVDVGHEMSVHRGDCKRMSASTNPPENIRMMLACQVACGRRKWYVSADFGRE
jgi:hypothetical protein